jgi:hypothetical protein
VDTNAKDRNDGRKMSSIRVKYLHAKKTENAKKVNTARRKTIGVMAGREIFFSSSNGGRIGLSDQIQKPK